MRPRRVPRNHDGTLVPAVAAWNASMRPRRVPRNHPGDNFFENLETVRFNEAEARASESHIV